MQSPKKSRYKVLEVDGLSDSTHGRGYESRSSGIYHRKEITGGWCNRYPHRDMPVQKISEAVAVPAAYRPFELLGFNSPTFFTLRPSKSNWWLEYNLARTEQIKNSEKFEENEAPPSDQACERIRTILRYMNKAKLRKGVVCNSPDGGLIISIKGSGKLIDIVCLNDESLFVATTDKTQQDAWEFSVDNEDSLSESILRVNLFLEGLYWRKQQ